MNIVNTLRRDTLSGKPLDPAQDIIPVAEFVDRDVPDRVSNVQIENSLNVKMVPEEGWTSKSICS